MAKRQRLPQSFFRQAGPDRPQIKSIQHWPTSNRGFYDDFRAWLRQGGYSASALSIYSVAARLALGWLDKAYWMIDPTTDLAAVRAFIDTHYPSQATRASYGKGLTKLAQFLRLRQNRPEPEPTIRWDYYLATLPAWLTTQLRTYLTHCQRNWPVERRRAMTQDSLSHLTLFLRWVAARQALTALTALTPTVWFDYLDARLADGITARTLNGQLSCLHAFLDFAAEAGQPICDRLRQVQPLNARKTMPKDVPLDRLRQIAAQIEADAQADHAGLARLGVMDRAWFRLMLHSGLRTAEVRSLRLADLDLTARQVRLDRAKGLKDRLVPLSRPTIDAIRAYLPLRGPARTDHLFLFRHQPLSISYCSQRLTTYGGRAGFHVSPHQLRHSCATLLLNVGTPVLTVQAILGHKYVDTTLGYARLYDGTVAADYYRAMAQVEPQFELIEDSDPVPTDPGRLLALVDALQQGTLNERQRDLVHDLRTGLLALTAQAAELPLAANLTETTRRQTKPD